MPLNFLKPVSFDLKPSAAVAVVVFLFLRRPCGDQTGFWPSIGSHKFDNSVDCEWDLIIGSREENFWGKWLHSTPFSPVEPFSIDLATRFGEGREPNEEALVERLRQFVEKSDLSFYRIASRIGTSGGTLSMWLAGKARPRADELAPIEKLLKG
jgi:hypothetical protein